MYIVRLLILLFLINISNTIQFYTPLSIYRRIKPFTSMKTKLHKLYKTIHKYKYDNKYDVFLNSTRPNTPRPRPPLPTHLTQLPLHTPRYILTDKYDYEFNNNTKFNIDDFMNVFYLTM